MEQRGGKKQDVVHSQAVGRSEQRREGKNTRIASEAQLEGGDGVVAGLKSFSFLKSPNFSLQLSLPAYG